MCKSKKDMSNQDKGIKPDFRLILINDDFNTFDYVIDCLTEILNFGEIQAEQSALIVHLKNEYEIKKGDKLELENYKERFVEKGLNVKIVY